MMADEYIRREDALKALFADYAYPAMDIIKSVPTADVVPVVRCKGCVNATQDGENQYRCIFNEIAVYTAEHYCAFGEKKCVQNSNDG